MDPEFSFQITMDGVLGVDQVTVTARRRAPVESAAAIAAPAPSIVPPAPPPLPYTAVPHAAVPAATTGPFVSPDWFPPAAQVPALLDPGFDLLAALSPRAGTWLKEHRLAASEVVCALLELAAGAAWPDSADLLEAPWARELAAWLSTNIRMEIGAITAGRDIVNAYQKHLSGKATWPGDLAVQGALRTLLLVQFGAQLSHDVRSESGCVRGYRGISLSPLPPFIPNDSQ